MKPFGYVLMALLIALPPQSLIAQGKKKSRMDEFRFSAKGKRKAFPTCLADGHKSETMRKITEIQRILSCQGKTPKECQEQSGLGKLGLAAGALVGATAAARIRNPEFRVCPFTPRALGPTFRIGVSEAYATSCTPENIYRRELLTDTIDRTRADLLDISLQIGRAEQALELERDRLLRGEIPQDLQDGVFQQIQQDIQRIDSENEGLRNMILEAEARVRSQTGGLSYDDLQVRLNELRTQRDMLMRAPQTPGEKPRLTASADYQSIQNEIKRLESQASALQGENQLMSDLRHQVSWNEETLRSQQARMRDVSADLSVARLSQVHGDLHALQRARGNVDWWNENLRWDRSTHSQLDVLGRMSPGTEFVNSVDKLRDAIGETSPQQGVLLGQLIQETHTAYPGMSSGWGADNIWRKLGIGGALFAFVTSASAEDFVSNSMSDAVFSDQGGCGEADPYFSFGVFEGGCRRITRLDSKSARFFELSEEKMEELIRNPSSFRPERNEFCELIENAHSNLVKPVAETKCSADVVEVNFGDGFTFFIPTSDRGGLQTLAIRGPKGIQEFDFSNPQSPKIGTRAGSGLGEVTGANGKLTLLWKGQKQGGRPVPLTFRSLKPGSEEYQLAMGQYSGRVVAAMEARACCVPDEVRPTPGECRTLGVRSPIPVQGGSTQDESGRVRAE